MKPFVLIQEICLALSLLLMPLLGHTKPAAEALPTVSAVQAAAREDLVRVRRGATGQVEEMPLAEYLWGVVAAEMPASYHIEALKAQTVAAHSFYLCRAGADGGAYDVTDEPSTDQAFLSREEAKAAWGEAYETAAAKIDEAVAAVGEKMVCCNGNVALCVYGAISGGRTESAETVWGNAVSYLVPVDSVGDLLCPDYLSYASFTPEEVRERLSGLAALPDDSGTWFQNPDYSESGTVRHLSFGDATLSGAAIRDALQLRSANFDVTYADGQFTFSVRGYGHLVGMSQYGAQYMALQGSRYDEILLWYYPGCEVV